MSEADDYPEWSDADWERARRGAPWRWAGERASALLRDALADLESRRPAQSPPDPAIEKLRAALATLEGDPAHAAE